MIKVGRGAFKAFNLDECDQILDSLTEGYYPCGIYSNDSYFQAELNSCLPKIQRVIFNGPATIVFWVDGGKTVVKCSGQDRYNKRMAIIWAVMKKCFGHTSIINKYVDNAIDQAEELEI